MNLIELKTQLKLLLSEVVEVALSNCAAFKRLRGVAYYDTEKDAFIKSLSQFAALVTGLQRLEKVQQQYGNEQSERIALQLVYQYFERANEILIDDFLLESLWQDFVAELDTEDWITRSVTNLRHFQCDEMYVDLGDGVAIYGRNQNVLAELGFHESIIDRIKADWTGFGASSFVLVAETTAPKRPDNVTLIDNTVVWRSARAIGAMRLIASGDVGMSVAFVQRIARFNDGLGGIAQGKTISTMGSLYTWLPAKIQLYKSTYRAMDKLEITGYDKAPGNLDLALRAFMSTYDRFPAAMDTKLVDSITALEAVLGSESESTFKLSFRVASLLASTDEERSTLLKLIKGFYDARSRIVHGGRLTDKHAKSLLAVDELRGLVRTLLQSFVTFAADNSRKNGNSFPKNELDAALINAKTREEIRMLLGLVK